MPAFYRRLDVLHGRLYAKGKEQFAVCRSRLMACQTVVVGSDSGGSARHRRRRAHFGGRPRLHARPSSSGCTTRRVMRVRLGAAGRGARIRERFTSRRRSPCKRWRSIAEWQRADGSGPDGRARTKVAINVQLLSDQHGYRGAGVSNYSAEPPRVLGALAVAAEEAAARPAAGRADGVSPRGALRRAGYGACARRCRSGQPTADPLGNRAVYPCTCIIRTPAWCTGW